MCERDDNPSKEQKTTKSYQWMLNTANSPATWWAVVEAQLWNYKYTKRPNSIH